MASANAGVGTVWRDTSLIALNMLSTWLTVFVNRYLFKDMGFDFPGTTTLVHYAVCAFGMDVLFRLGFFVRPPPLTGQVKRDVWLLIVVFSVGPMLSNASLSLSSIGFYQISKLSVTPAIVLAEWWLYNKTISLRRVVALGVLASGVALASVMDVQLTLMGLLVALLLIPIATAYKVLASHIQKNNLSTMQLLDYILLPSTLFGALIVPLTDDLTKLREFPLTGEVLAVLLASAVAAFAINCTGFLVVKEMSALTHQISGQGKSVVILLIGFIFYDRDPGQLRMVFGAAVAMVALGVYTHYTLAEQSAKRAVASPSTGGKEEPA